MTPATQVVAYDADNARVRGAPVVAAALGRTRRGRGARRRIQGVDCRRIADDHRGSAPSRRPLRSAAESRHVVRRAAKSPSACSAPTGVCSTRARRSASPAKSSRSIRSPATCRARAIIRSRPTSAATAASHRAQELRKRFSQSQDGVADDHTIVMCGSGVTACNLLLAMEARRQTRRATVRRLVERMDPRSAARRDVARSGSDVTFIFCYLSRADAPAYS